MGSEQHHEDLVGGLERQLKQIFDSSDQAIFLYLDDVHKACNKKFSSLLGYSSPADWAKVKTSVPETFVDKSSQKILVASYQDAMEKLIGSTFDVTWRKKSGATVATKVIMVPISYEGHMFALHFVSEKK
jgi:PAS domain-containing protein